LILFQGVALVPHFEHLSLAVVVPVIPVSHAFSIDRFWHIPVKVLSVPLVEHGIAVVVIAFIVADFQPLFPQRLARLISVGIGKLKTHVARLDFFFINFL